MVVSEEIAVKEVNEWLDFKKVSPEKRLRLSANIQAIINAVIDGTFIIDPQTKEITHKLKFPAATKSEIKYKPRLTMGDLQSRLQNVRSGDLIGTNMAYLSALSGEAVGVFMNMDSEDSSLADGLAFFFMA